MANANDVHDAAIVVDLEDDAMVTDSNPVLAKTATAFERGHSTMARVRGESVDCLL